MTGATGCLEISVTTYQLTMLKIAEEHRPQLHRGVIKGEYLVKNTHAYKQTNQGIDIGTIARPGLIVHAALRGLPPSPHRREDHPPPVFSFSIYNSHYVIFI